MTVVTQGAITATVATGFTHRVNQRLAVDITPEGGTADFAQCVAADNVPRRVDARHINVTCSAPDITCSITFTHRHCASTSGFTQRRTSNLLLGPTRNLSL